MKLQDAVILAPVMPAWDGGAFCAPLVTLLEEKGFSVTIVDTLSLITHDDPQSAIDALCQTLNAQVKRPWLLVGFAMAGTLVQLLAHRLRGVAGVLSVSAPGFADEKLTQRLVRLISLLEKGELGSAMDILHHYVLPEGLPAPREKFTLPDTEKMSAIKRMLTGFSLLLKMDARADIAAYDGNYLAIVGEKSQLASWENQTHSPRTQHYYKRIPGVGMRPWNDNPAAVNALLNEWIDTL
ncbi:TPA: alpha/beta hydrolase [Enterobacter bugandensis]|uniref:alpha/beta fold hydrolase n=1 Tax=Enterobacter bugandensis TaxID=881260 RepID=UPI0020052F9C|nr:alpha/beta hydrolase [Enterobacter bugandensis]MCK7409587.1 hypothetical protein [Enterobacter bugandensis]